MCLLDAINGPTGTILELWVPAEELDEFNRHIISRIKVVHEFRPQPHAEASR